MSILFKRAFSQATNLVLVAILLLVAVVALIYAFNRGSLPISWISNLAQVTQATSDKVIFNSGTSTICTDDNTKASVSAGSAENGGNAILISTTRWAGAMIQFSDACGGAVNFGIYDRIEFHIRGTSSVPDPIRVYLHRYGPDLDSAPFSISPTSGWTTISVPIASLKNSWDLSNTQNLQFSETASGSSYYIDSIVLKAAGTAPPQQSAAPVVTLSASPTSITSGQSSTLTWSSTNSPTSCTASGGWSGAKSTSGNETVTPTTNTTYTLTCTNAGGASTPANVSVTVSGTAQTSQKVTAKGWTPPTSNILSGSSPTPISFTLNWAGGTNTPAPRIGGAWKVFVHIENISGNNSLPSADFSPSVEVAKWSGNVSTAVNYTIPSNTPAGTYRVLVGLYSGNERLDLDAQSPAFNIGGRRYQVGSFSVTTAGNTLTPNITSLNFSYCIQGAWLCRLDIKGTNFGIDGNNVKLTNTASPFQATSLGINGTSYGNLPSGNGTQIVADVERTLPVGKYNLTNTVSVNNVAKTSNSVPFEMLPISAVPTITGVSPVSGLPGTVVSISGTHFDGNNTVQIGPFYFNNVVPDATGKLNVAMPSSTYSSYTGVALKVAVDNDSYGYSGDNPNAAAYTFTITTGTPTDMVPPVISAIASTTNNTSATISWTTNESSDTQVVYGTSIAYGSNTTLNTAMVTGHSAQITGLQPNALYHFVVRSRDAAGNVATSTDKTFMTTGSDTSAPFPPLNLTGTATTSTQVGLSWVAASDNVGVIGYQVFRNNVFIATSTTLGYFDRGLTPATTYTYSVKAFDAAKNISGASNTVNVTTAQTGVVTATISSDKTGVKYGEKAVLTWSSTGATGCTLTDGADDNSDGWNGATTTAGTLAVSPSINTGYSVACTGPSGTSPIATAVVLHVDANPGTGATFVGLSATAQKSPAQITLSWYPDPWNQVDTYYTIYRSTTIGGPANGVGNWTKLTPNEIQNKTSYTDDTAVVGVPYEYRVTRRNSVNGQWNGDAYIYTGIELPQVTSRGKIILLIDSRFTSALATKIDRLKDDLVGDGWVVLDHIVTTTGGTPDTTTSVKNIIKADYNADPTNVKAVFLLGHIPVFKSGSLRPDGHESRAMPADGFYGDMDGAWDSSTSYIPSDIELEVGRVDMYNMTDFAPLTETDLLSQYLDKDHAFRTKAFDSAIYNNPKAAVMESDTNKSYQRQFFGAVLPVNIPNINLEKLYSPTFWNDVQSNSYLWFSKGGGGGQATGATGIGFTSDFAKSPGYKVVFNSMFASYFVNWDDQNNLLRAPLAAKGYALTNAWSDNPAWVFVHMGLGKEIGFSTKASQNNNTYYNIPGYKNLPNSIRGVHINLMGDPTLRMHVVAPVTSITRTDGTGTTALTWGASPDAGRGYNVYRSTNGKEGPFTLVTSAPVTGTSYTDTSGGEQYTYMVRAVKLEITPSGSYINQSQGVFSAAGVTRPEEPPTPAGEIDVSGGLKIWDGDVVSGAIVSGTLVPGRSGNAAQSNEKTSWGGLNDWMSINIASLNIQPKYDKLVFYIKSNNPSGVSGIRFYLGLHNGETPNPETTPPVVILPGGYVDGNKIDTSWHQVVIDTADIRRSNATYLTFRFNNPGTVIVVDDFYLVNSKGNAPAYETVSSRVIRLSMPEAYDRVSAVTTGNYILRDKLTNTVVPIIGVGRESLLTGFVGPLLLPPAEAPITTNNIYLVFNGDMVAKKQYELTINNIKTADGISYTKPEVITFTYDDTQVNHTVKANQVGFLPSAHKYIYIGNYLGDYQEFGNLPIPTTPVCKLFSTSVLDPWNATALATINATNEGDDIQIGTHAVGLDVNGDGKVDDNDRVAHRYSMSGEKVYSCDFVNYQTPGNYYVHVPGYGKTYPFSISSSVYNDVFKITAKGLYFQRDDIAITTPYANGIAWGAGKSWPRASGSGLDATSFVHSSVLLNPFGKAADVHKVVDTRKGWYDAADYGKYVESGSGALYELLTAYELQPTKYTDGQLNIPESGNGAPDLLDEAKWELDWMLSMQNTTDGFVYHRVATSQWGNLAPWNDNDPRWLSEKSTSATLRFAAIMAKASVDLKPYFPTEAATYLARARMAFAAAYPGAGTSERAGFNGSPTLCVGYDAARNPNPGRPCLIKGDGSTLSFNGSTITETATGGGENADAGNSDDERLWAAAELFRATNETAYHANFKDMANRVALQTTWNAYGSDSDGRAGFTYARTPGADQAIVNKYLYVGNNTAYTVTNPGPATLLAFANETVKNIRDNTYHNGSYTTTLGSGWGAFSESSRWAWTLIKAYELTKDINPSLAATYLDNAKIALDVQLGGNPLNKTFITGVGSNPPMRPLHTISSTDGKDDPVPGIPIYGTQNELTDGAPHRKVNELTYPSLVSKWDSFPIWRRYVDSSAIVDMGEFTIIDMGYTAAVFGYLSN